MRNAITQSIHAAFQEEDFIHVMTPIITSNDCEGAGEMFSYVDYDLVCERNVYFHSLYFYSLSIPSEMRKSISQYLNISISQYLNISISQYV